MPRPTRLSLLLVPIVLSVLSQALPGRAQTAPSVRYAFADTTLLRDTLGLSFDRLFPTADSLQLTPDTLRALMIRYRLTMPRILHLSDSLGMTVDSVGVFLDRQKLNPLAHVSGRQTSNSLEYVSGYDIQRTSTTWTNGSTYRFFTGPFYLSNLTNIELQRILASGTTSLRQNREATTEAGLTVNKGLSLGARSYQLRFFSADPGSPITQDETKSEYGFTARATTARGRGLSSEMGVRTGYLDDRGAIAIKRGLSGTADGRIRYNNPGLLISDLSGTIDGNVSRSRAVQLLDELRTHDISTNVRGTLSLLPNSPVRLNLNYGLRSTHVETPLDSVINLLETQNKNLDGTVRFRLDNDHYLDVGANLSRSGTLTGNRKDSGGSATVRWSVLGWALDGSYAASGESTLYLRRLRNGGYLEKGVSHSADATLARNFLDNRIIARIVASIGLDQSRYRVIEFANTAITDSVTPPGPRDSYRQSLRSEVNYVPSLKLSTRVAGQVSLNRTISLLASTTSSNTDVRSYRAEWSWTYRMLTSLSVTQSNQVQADYTQYPFAPDHNTLSLSYLNTTTLNATLPGGLGIDISHSLSQTPRGTYTRQDNGLEALELSDEGRNYTLGAAVRYALSTGISLHVEPRYTASDRSGTVNGVQAKQRTDKRLDFQGGVDMNLHVSSRGMLTGRLSRAISDQRTITYTNGLPDPTPRSETDYWNGNLQLTWTL